MKSLVFILLLIGLVLAFNVRPDYIEIQDTGDKRLETMEVNITIDCETKALSIAVASATSQEPISNASTYLFYTDYAYQVISTGTSGEDGIADMSVIGTIDYLTALFILRVDHPNYQSREIEFTYERCFEELPEPPPVEPEEEEQPPEEVEEPSVVTPPPQEIPPPPDVSEEEGEIEDNIPNITPPMLPATDLEEPEATPEEQEEAPICPLGVLLLSVLVIKSQDVFTS